MLGVPPLEPGRDRLQTDNWVIELVPFLEEHHSVALASAWYDELSDESQRGRFTDRHDGWLEVFPIVGHCVIHRGSFLDHTGYFDVLAPDHLYCVCLDCHRL
jgi:hypothetical protein